MAVNAIVQESLNHLMRWGETSADCAEVDVTVMADESSIGGYPKVCRTGLASTIWLHSPSLFAAKAQREVRALRDNILPSL